MGIDLLLLGRRLGLEIHQLRVLALDADLRPADEASVFAEYCVVQLQDSWNRFIRDVIFSSATGRAVRGDGTPVLPGPCGPLRQEPVLQHLRANWPRGRKPVYWEPNWYSVTDVNHVVDVLQMSNGDDIKTAIGASTNPIEEVRPIRNFCAHRGAGTAGRLGSASRSWGPPTWRRPEDLILHRPLGLESQFEAWCRSFALVAGAML